MYKIIVFAKWCQNLPLPEMAALLKEIGADGVDLPCRPNAAISPEDAPEILPVAKKIFEDHGLSLERIVTGITRADEQADRQLEAIRNAGVKRIRIGGFHVGAGINARSLLAEAQMRMAEVQKLLVKHDIRGAVQNHSGNSLEVNVSGTLRLLEDCDPEWVGVQYDPGHLTLSGEPFGLAIDLLGPSLHSVNFKSPRQEYFADPNTGQLRFKPIWVPLIDGMLDAQGVLKKLQEVGYRDAISVHSEYRTHYHQIEHFVDPTAKLAQADIAYVKNLMR